MQRLFLLLGAFMCVQSINAQDSVHVEMLPLYFEQIFTFVEQAPDFPGGEQEFTHVINNNITFPNSFKNEKKADAGVKGYANNITLNIACLVDKEGKVLHVQSTVKSKTTIPEKDVNYLQNQIAYLLVNNIKNIFKPAKLNGQKTYAVYEREVVLYYSASQKPRADWQVKPTKEFYKKPVAVHFMTIPPTYGSNTDVEINKLLQANIKVPDILSGYTFSGLAYMYIDETGQVKAFTFPEHNLLKNGKKVELKHDSGEYIAYNQLGENIQVYLAKLKGWQPGTVGGYPAYSILKIPVCVGANCH